MSLLADLLLLALGFYLGIGFAIGVWYYVDDHYDDPRLERIVIGGILMFVWGPLLAMVAIHEEVIK